MEIKIFFWLRIELMNYWLILWGTIITLNIFLHECSRAPFYEQMSVSDGWSAFWRNDLLHICTDNTASYLKKTPLFISVCKFCFSLSHSVYSSRQVPIHSETRTSTLDGSIRFSALERNTITTSPHPSSFTSFSVCSATELASTAYTCREHDNQVRSNTNTQSGFRTEN